MSEPSSSAAGFVEGEPVPPDEPTDFLREPCPEPGCSTVAIGSTEDDIRAVLYGHRKEHHRD